MYHYGRRMNIGATSVNQQRCVQSQFSYVYIYNQNNNGISDSTGLKYDDTFKHMKEEDADIFCINETHADKNECTE